MRFHPLALLVFFLPAPAAIFAQTTPASPAAAAVELSPFVVNTSTDVGWSGTETLMGSRTKQALKDVPFAIEAITSDFLVDLDLATADDAARFVAGLHAEFQMDNRQDQAAVSFRGIASQKNLTRNYFPSNIPSDTYNVDRIDFGKGSNSLVFGDTEPGGQGSVSTKRAQFRNFGRAYLQYGSEDAHRVELDLNRKLTDTVAVRFNFVKRDQKTYQDFSVYQLKAAHGTLTWRPFKHTEIRIEAEQGEFANNRGFTGIKVREQSGRSLGFATNFWYVTSDGATINTTLLPAPDRTATNVPTGGALSLLEGGSFDVRLLNAAGAAVGTKRITGFPQNYNLRGTDDLFSRPFNTHTFSIEQRLGKLGLEFAYNFQNENANRNDGNFADTISVDVNGRPYIDVDSINRKYIGDEAHAFRLAGVLPVQPFKWMRQLLVGALEYRELWRSEYRTQLYNYAGIDNRTLTQLSAPQRIRYRAYLDDPTFYSKAFFDKFQVENLPRSAAFRPDFFSYDSGDSYFERSSSASIAATGNYFDGRFQTVIGIRRDQTAAYDYVSKLQRIDAIGQQLPAPRREKAAVGDYVTNPELVFSKNSGSVGLTYALTKSLNVYGSWASSFRSQRSKTFDRDLVGPITGVTKEIGLKGDFIDRKATISLGVFEIDRQNVAYAWTPFTLMRPAFEDLFNPNGLSPTDPTFFQMSDNNTFNIVRSTETSRGFDTTVLLRPVRGLQLRLTLAKIALQTNPEFGSFRTRLAAAKARGNENPSYIADAELILDSSDVPGKPTGARGSPWSGSWALDYIFSRDAMPVLRGVRAGLNGYWRKNYLLGVRNNVEFHGGATHIVGAYLMRNQKIWGHDVRLRLGAKNLFDFANGDTPRKTGIVNKLDGSTVYSRSYIMPALYDASITVQF